MTFCPCNSFSNVASGGATFGGAADVAPHFYYELATGGVEASGISTIDVPTQVWDSFASVHHLLEDGDGTPDEYVDSGVHALHGQGGDGVAAYVPTQVSGVGCITANEFDGNDFVSIPMDDMPNTSPITVSLWAKVTNKFLGRVFFSRGRTVGIDNEGWSIQFGHNEQRRLSATVQVVGEDDWETRTANGSTTLDLERVYHVAMVWQPGSGLTLYLNGVANGSKTIDETSLVPSTLGSFFGRVDNMKYAKAILQEVRVAPTARSTAWLKAEHDNFCDPDFVLLGDEESGSYS